MSDEEIPDVSDPDIRQMVLRNHTPTELWNNGGLLIGIRCDACHNRWPCDSILAARQEPES